MRARRPGFVWWLAVVMCAACGGDDEGGGGRDSGERDLGSAPADATMDAPAPTDAAVDTGEDGGSSVDSGPAVDADGMLDSEVADAAGGDSGAVDGGPDSGPVDASVVDSSIFDAGVADTGSADAGCSVPCGATCCAPGFVCGPSTGRCLAPCASGRPFCGLGDECCADESICEPITGTCAMECAPGVPPCGDVCCDSEAFCDESTVSCVATCGPGRTCGPRCCAPGAVCDADTTTCTDACPPDRRCGDICCPSDEQCGPTTGRCLPRCASGLWCGPTDLCCGARDLCRFSACLPDLGTCTTDAECLTDSYCDGGLCTPYGFGPRGSSAPMCSRVIPLGLFSPTIQCEWPGPPAGDPFPSHGNVLVTPAVVDLDMDVDPLTLLPSIVVTSYNGEDGGSGACTGDGTFFGVIRILDGNTCAQQHTLSAVPVIGSGNPAVGDLDGDGRPEIVAPAVGGGVAIYRFDVLTRTWSGRRATNAGGTPST
ncbi:MAG: hypothetical protein IT379_15270, partial [Deltaproteobacteria bacterium]|nr:hypothetical protein [Deltaproteobacteria bacterium]